MSLEKTQPKVSIIINNYNYARFLGQAIDSAIDQTYPNLEIIVVDDGSTDNSRKIIANYGNKIIPILKQNSGQGSALNSGFQFCTGDYICFLDSDDVFHPNKVEECLNLSLRNKSSNPFTMVYHLLEVTDKDGNSQNWFKPSPEDNNSPTNFYEYACKYRYVPFAAAPTSGLMLSRKLAKLIFPIPENGVCVSADKFVVSAALLLGEVYRVEKVLGNYRVHGKNNWESNKKTKIHSIEYLRILDNFLNSKLEQNSKPPIMSSYNSMEARRYYLEFGTYKDLLNLAWNVVTWHQDSRTIEFFSRTIWQTLKRQIKRYIVKNIFKFKL